MYRTCENIVRKLAINIQNNEHTTFTIFLQIFYNSLFYHTSPLQLCFKTHLWNHAYLFFFIWTPTPIINRLQQFLLFIWYFPSLFIIINLIHLQSSSHDLSPPFTLIILYWHILFISLSKLLLIAHTTTQEHLNHLKCLSTLHCFSIAILSVPEEWRAKNTSHIHK